MLSPLLFPPPFPAGCERRTMRSSWLARRISPRRQEQAAQRGRARAKLAPRGAGACSAPASPCRLALPLSLQNAFSPGSVHFETHGGFTPGVSGWLLSRPMSEHRLDARVGSAEGGPGCAARLSSSLPWLGRLQPSWHKLALIRGLLRHGAYLFLRLCCRSGWLGADPWV